MFKSNKQLYKILRVTDTDIDIPWRLTLEAGLTESVMRPVSRVISDLQSCDLPVVPAASVFHDLDDLREYQTMLHIRDDEVICLDRYVAAGRTVFSINTVTAVVEGLKDNWLMHNDAFKSLVDISTTACVMASLSLDWEARYAWSQRAHVIMCSTIRLFADYMYASICDDVSSIVSCGSDIRHFIDDVEEEFLDEWYTN